MPDRREPRGPRAADARPARLGRTLLLAALVAALCCALVGLAMGWTAGIALAIVAASAIQGAWRGGVEAIAVLVGTATAILLAPAVGTAVESLLSGLVGTSGLLNRALSIAAWGLLILAAVALLTRAALNRAARRLRARRTLDARLGAGIGLATGALMALALAWTFLALEPIARAQLARTNPRSPATARTPRLPAIVARIAGDLRASPLGRLAAATSPIADSTLLALAERFARVSRDQAALRWFLDTPAMQQAAALESVRYAEDRCRADPALAELFGERGITARALLVALESDTVLAILDHTTIADDLRPLAGDLLAALAEAESRIDPGGG